MHVAHRHHSKGARTRHRLSRARPHDSMDTVSLNGDRVRDSAGEEIGRLEGVMLDGSRNRLMYAVLSLDGSLGGDNRLFAVPWSVLRMNADDACVILDVPKKRLKAAPGFRRDSWPSVADPGWREQIDTYYGVRTEHKRTRSV